MCNLVVELNGSPFESYLKLLEQVINLRLKASELPLHVARLEVNDCSASAGHLLVTLYPSDAFLGLAAALGTG
jgi:hypothetical protein